MAPSAVGGDNARAAESRWHARGVLLDVGKDQRGTTSPYAATATAWHRLPPNTKKCHTQWPNRMRSSQLKKMTPIVYAMPPANSHATPAQPTRASSGLNANTTIQPKI